MNTIEPYSKNDMFLLKKASFDKRATFDIEYVDKLFQDRTKTYNVIKSLIKKGAIYSYSKSKYIILDNNYTGITNKIYYIISLLCPKYYIGYFNAFNYYGLTTQIPQTLFVVNSTFSETRKILNQTVKFIKTDSKNIFGLKKIDTPHMSYYISDLERTIVDAIENYKMLSNFKAIINFIQNNKKKIDTDKLWQYANTLGNIGTIKRIAYILIEIYGIPLSKTPNFSKTSLIALDPSKGRSGTINKKYNLIINI